MEDLKKMKERRNTIIRRARNRLLCHSAFRRSINMEDLKRIKPDGEKQTITALRRPRSQFDIEIQQQKEMMVVIRELHSLRERQLQYQKVNLIMSPEQPFPIISRRTTHKFKALRIRFKEPLSSGEEAEERDNIEILKHTQRQIKMKQANMDRIKQWRKTSKEQLRGIDAKIRPQSRMIDTPKSVHSVASKW